MKLFWKDVAVAILMGVVVPWLVLEIVVQRETVPETPEVTEAEHGEEQVQTIRIPVLSAGEVTEMELGEYLTGVVLAEMPADFEEEALKAQAVVARTYTVRAYRNAEKHTDAAVCTDSNCCQGYVSEAQYLENGGSRENVEKIRGAVQETEGQVLTYEGDLIEATYFSCSGGSTEDAEAVWGTEVPYLQATVSPGEENAAHYTDTVTFTAEEFCEKLGYCPDGGVSKWFGAVTYTTGGGVDTMEIGGKKYEGTELRRLLGLRSTAFTVITGDEAVIITTRGYGHRVGMSQYGADAMAVLGSSYREILAYYYKGTELATLSN